MTSHWGLVLVIAFIAIPLGGGCFWWLRKKSPAPLGLGRAVMAVALLGGVIMPCWIALGGLHTKLDAAAKHSGFEPVATTFWLLTGGVLLLSAHTWSGRGLARLRSWQFLLAFLFVSMWCRYAYLSLMDIEPMSDFGKMWKLACRWAEHGWSPVADIRAPRVVPLLYPVAAIFGCTHAVYEALNIVCFGCSAVLMHHLGCRYTNENATRAVMLLVLFAPETFYASALPTHDILSVPFFLGAIALGHWTWDLVGHARWRRAALAALLTGILWLLLELQRGNTIVLIAATAGVLVLFPAPDTGNLKQKVGAWALRAAFVLVLPFTVWKAGAAGLQGAEVILIPPKTSGRWFAANTDTWAGGSYRYANRNYYSHYSHTSLKDGGGSKMWYPLAYSKFLSQTHYNPASWKKYYQRKTKQLYALGAQTWIYLSRKAISSRSPLRGKEIRRFLTDWNHLYSSVFLGVLGVAGLLAACFGGWATGLAVPVLAMTVLSLVLIAMGETQPRYLYAWWFIGPLLLASSGQAAIDAFKRMRQQTWAKARRTLGLQLGLGLSSLTVVLGFTAIAAASLVGLASKSDRVMIDMRKFSDVQASQDFSNKSYQRIPQKYVELEPLRRTLRFPEATTEGDRIWTELNVAAAGSEPRTLKLFVRGKRAKGRKGKKTIIASVKAGDQAVKKTLFGTGSRGSVLVIPGIQPKDGSISIRLALEAKTNLSAAYARGAPVHFEFMTLTKD